MGFQRPEPLIGKSLESRKYFVWNGVVYERLIERRAVDAVLARNTETDRKELVSSSFLKNSRSTNLYSTQAATRICNRDAVKIREACEDAGIEYYGLEKKYGHKIHELRYFDADNIIELCEYFVDQCMSHPKKRLVNYTRSVADARAILNQTEVKYVRNKAGAFVPVWEERN